MGNRAWIHLAWISLAATAGCRSQPEQVRICHPAALSPLIQASGELYQSNHPSVRIVSQAGSSLQCVAAIQSGHADLAALSDLRLIDRFLRPRGSSPGHAFLSDEIVLAAAPGGVLSSQQAKESWRKDWPRLLFRQKRRYGICDKDRDPAGYQGHLVWKLSEIDYDAPGLYRRLLDGLDPAWVRDDPQQLAAALSQGAIDLAFLPASAARRKGIDWVRLPARVSLGEPAHRGFYGRVFQQVELMGEAFEVSGAPIRIGLCSAGQDGWPDHFLDFLLSPEVRRLARRQGFGTIIGSLRRRRLESETRLARLRTDFEQEISDRLDSRRTAAGEFRGGGISPTPAGGD